MNGAVRNPVPEESNVAPVTIMDGLGRVIRVVPAEEFRRAHGNPEVAGALRRGLRLKGSSGDVALSTP